MVFSDTSNIHLFNSFSDDDASSVGTGLAALNLVLALARRAGGDRDPSIIPDEGLSTSSQVASTTSSIKKKNGRVTFPTTPLMQNDSSDEQLLLLASQMGNSDHDSINGGMSQKL